MYFRMKTNFMYIHPEEIFFIVKLDEDSMNETLENLNNRDSFHKVRVFKRDFEIMDAEINDYTINNHRGLFIDEPTWNKIKNFGNSIFQIN